MIQIQQIDVTSKTQVNQFIQFHYDLYKNCPQWVPPFYSDVKVMLNPQKHPFYDKNVADFFVAIQDGKVVGRIAALENRLFNEYHGKKEAIFYLYDSIDDQQVSDALLNRVFEWAKKRGLDTVIGPKGFTIFDGYGIQIEGNDLRQMMTMMNYNYPYYRQLVENIGFEKEVDFVSCHLTTAKFNLPAPIHEISRRVQERGTFKVLRFKNKKELTGWAGKIGQAYNKTFVNNWEYYPLSEREIKFNLDNLMSAVVPDLIKIIVNKNDEVVGFMFGFPDISAALQRQGGRITPWGIADYLLEIKRTKFISLNGVGVLPEYHGRGGNYLMMSEMEKTIKDSGFSEAELTQVAESAVQMRRDLENVGGRAYKNHRVYHKKI